MYREPTCRNTSYHKEISLGKERKARLDPLSKTASVQYESPKKYATRKPTITMRRSLTLEAVPSSLSVHALNGTITLNSATLHTSSGEIKLPLLNLKDLIFAPEGEVQYNISQCVRSGRFELGSGLYSNFDEVTYDYSQPYYLPSMEISTFLLKSKAVYSRALGKITQKLEDKGLVLKYCRMVEFNGPCVVNAWQGCEAQGVVKKILSMMPEEFYEVVTWDRAKKMLPRDAGELVQDIVPKFCFRVQEEYVRLEFPFFKYSEDEKEMPVPLGMLKEMIDNNFMNWADVWLKKNNESFPHRRSGLDNSSLKASLCVKDEPCVLTLNSYEIQISNTELEASFAFKLSDIELILAHSGNELISHLMKTAQLVSKENRKRQVWDLVIHLDDLPVSKGEVPKESKVQIEGKEFKCKFFTPSIELYKPHSGETEIIKLKPEEIQQIYKSQFKGWESFALKYIQ